MPALVRNLLAVGAELLRITLILLAFLTVLGVFGMGVGSPG
jgi:hypothetical protein